MNCRSARLVISPSRSSGQWSRLTILDVEPALALSPLPDLLRVATISSQSLPRAFRKSSLLTDRPAHTEHAPSHSSSDFDSQLGNRIVGLRNRVQRIRDAEYAGQDERWIEEAASLAEIETEVFAVDRECGPSTVRESASRVLGEVELLQASSRRLQADACTAEADVVIADYLAERARRWSEMVTAELAHASAESCFQHLLQTTIHEEETLEHAPSVEDHESRAIFAQQRAEIRAAFLKALERHPAGDETRERWVTALTDRADMVRAAADGHSPERGAAQVAVIRDDLEWHMQHVEKLRGKRRRKVRRKHSRLKSDHQEHVLQQRLYSLFGERFVKHADRFILFLILLVVMLIAIDTFVTLSPTAQLTFYAIDGMACLIFMTEFVIKLSRVPGRWRWFRRHFLIDFVPSIPFGLIFIFFPPATATTAGGVRGIGFLARLARFSRLARYFRALGLMSRALDRLARQYGHLLNQNVILYPTREELARSRSALPAHLTGLRRLHAEIRVCWIHLASSSEAAVRDSVIRARLSCLNDELHRAAAEEDFLAETEHQSGPREIAAEVLINQLATVTPQVAETALTADLIAQMSRVIRMVARPPLRWLPILRRFAPPLTPQMTDAQVTAAAGRHTGRIIRKYHNRWFWVADLYGTVTPSQFVDRLGGMLVKSSFKPASRLLIFGGLFLLTNLLLSWSPLPFLEMARGFLNRFVGPVLLILGGVCFVILGLGWWLQRVAREATEFYERSVYAQFLSLTEIVRSRYLRRDAAVLHTRVLQPEQELKGIRGRHTTPEGVEQLLDHIHRSLTEAHFGVSPDLNFRGIDTSLLLYRDWLDGAIFTDNDTRCTSQLLGSPSVRQFLSLSGRIGKKDLKLLQALDLVRQKSLFGGPYIWFNFISRSIAHSVAGLIVDYNQRAIPRSELVLVGEEERERFRMWLMSDTAESLDTRDTVEKNVERDYVTNAFTALHFLDFDPLRDAEVASRFGFEVLKRLQRDRSFLIRRIFGTYPMHDRPKSQRIVNLYTLYNSWLAEGRVLFLPWFLFVLLLQLFWAFLKWVAHSVQQIRRPDNRKQSDAARTAHFHTAVRKIDRIRGPAVDSCLKLRMHMDPEYLGIALPHNDELVLKRSLVDIDLEFLNPAPELLERVRDERQRAREDMSRLRTLLHDGLLEEAATRRGLNADVFQQAEHRRAVAIAYTADYCNVRRGLSALGILDDAIQQAVTKPVQPGTFFPRFRLKSRFNKYWERHGSGNRDEKHAAWRAVLNNYWGAADALNVWHTEGESAYGSAVDRLGEVLLHPGRLTEQLVTMRTIQTLSVLDVLNYREHVYRLGQYEDMGDTAEGLLNWRTLPQELDSYFELNEE